jgi:hypothetical protein
MDLVKVGSALQKSLELRIKFSAGRQFSASKSSSSPSAWTLEISLVDSRRQNTLQQSKKEINRQSR